MTMTRLVRVRALGGEDVASMRAMLGMFGEAFVEPRTYTSAQPDDAYLKRLLSGSTFVAVAALDGSDVIGGIAAYVLPKFEQARAELYLYDLAVSEAYRRSGVATAMIEELKKLAVARGIYVIYVQADHGDDAAIALYTKLGVRQDVLHFDISPLAAPPGTSLSPELVMHQPESFTPEVVLQGYFQAKDENRPHLLEDVFTSGAELVIRNGSANIAFPAVTQGRSAIADVLVRTFALCYENIYSFCLARPAPGAREFTCPWLVGMSERSSGDVRVGCGTYDWAFDTHAPYLASRLVITIECMQVLPPAESQRVFAWLQALDYPWSTPEGALHCVPASELLAPVAQFLSRNSAGEPTR